MKTLFSTLFLSLALCACSYAQSIGVSFSGDNGGGNSIQITPSQTAGVVPASNWNTGSDATGSIADLNDDSGASTGASVSWGGSNNVWGGDGATTDDEAMVNGWLDDNGNGASVDVTGIPFDLYDVYVYGSSDNGNAGSGLNTVVNGTKYYSGGEFTALGPGGSYFDPAVGYVDGASTDPNPSFFKIGGQSGSSLSIFGANDTAGPALPGGGTRYRGGIAGFQIVAIPEPSSLALFGIALCGMLTLRRRK